MRQAFVAQFGVPPSEYRARQSGSLLESASAPASASG
jgi:hypothetical protein